MKNSSWYAAVVVSLLVFPLAASSTGDNKHNPTWWAKYQYLAKHGATSGGSGGSVNVGANVDVSNECGPQSETYIALNSAQPRTLAGGANEIFRLPMRGYFSSDGGENWGGVDLPLPPPLQGTSTPASP